MKMKRKEEKKTIYLIIIKYMFLVQDCLVLEQYLS